MKISFVNRDYFSLRSMLYTMNRTYFFGFPRNIFKVFLKTTFVHISCYPDHYEPKIIFSIFEVRNYPSIYDFGLEVSPWKCNLRRQASPLQLELGSGSSRYRRYVSRMTWIENFLSQNFSKFFWKPLFSTIHATLITLSQKYFFWIGKKWKFWIRNQRELSNLYYENWLKMKILIT